MVPTLRRATAAERVLIIDYGGVLTNPIAETISAFVSVLQISPAALWQALLAASPSPGETVMAPLERAEITEAEFIQRVGAELSVIVGRVIDLSDFRTPWFTGRTANRTILDHLEVLRVENRRMALLTNNVKEWEPYWRSIVPADRLFDVVVNSAEEGVRKPELEIYRRTVDRLGVSAEQCLFVDDDPANCAVGAELGMTVHRFVDAAAAVSMIDEWFGRAIPPAFGRLAETPDLTALYYGDRS
jgi:putative hydrolase of the HAD superfamily